MPIYEYKCSKCGKQFEVLQKINSEPLSNCIHCQGKVEKLISLSSFQFKGTGWYITDYKNKENKQNETPNKTAVSKTETKKEKKTEKSKNATIK